MAKVYIAGPMRNLPGLNFAAFDDAARLGRALGWTVISPAETERELGHDPDAYVDTFNAVREQVHHDVGTLVSFRAEDGDAIALLPNWWKSQGAKAELAVAHWLKLKVLDAATFLPLVARIIGAEDRPPVPARFATCVSGTCGSLDIERETYAMKTLAERVANGETKY